MKTLTLRLPNDLHRELKILSASSGVTMSELLLKAVRIITRMKTTDEMTFSEAFDKPVPEEDQKELRNYSKKEIEDFIEADKI